MLVSSRDVQQFLLEVILNTNFPGKMAEFVVMVKNEITAAEVEGEQK